MAEITFDGLNENSLIMQWNTDNYGNPKSIHINNEVQQVSPTHHVIQLAQIPDEYYRARFVAEGINGWLIEVRSLRELKNINNYYVDYNHGIVYFHEEMAGRLVRADYYGRGVMFLSDTRIFHKSGDSFATTLDEVLEKSEDAFKLLESTGGLNQAIELLENKAEEGNKVADRLENFITETQFYGYTIVLSREAFVVRAKEDGNLHNGEMEDLTVDVVVYKGAKNLSAPDLDVRLYSTTNCECEIENQKLTVTRIDVDCIQAQAIIEIDCGDGLIAYRTIEITKVFDGVSQFNVEMTNAFHSFSATHSGKIEEEQSVTCEFTVTKANEEFKGYVVGIQNVPSGITHNLKKPTENASSVTFTAQPGTSLPDNASISIVFQFNDYVITKTFAFTKSKQGLSAKSLRLAGNQIIHYENPNYEGTPNPTRTSIVAQVTDLSGTPVWSYLEGEEWIIIDGQNGTNLNLYHNDRIWTNKRELTVKCELDGFSDEITLIKVANGAMGLSSYSVILSNESTTLRVGLDGKIPTEELTSQYTRITAFKGADQITPTSITVPQGDNYEVSVSGSTINLINVDASTSTVNIPIEILLDNAVVVNKVWSIAKTEKGEIGAAGAAYSINVEGGTRAITYNQLNENPRPTFSGVFTAHIYENGNDITSQIKSWYWTTQGHFTGTSINSSFTPEIKDRFDESILNNSVTVTAIYNHMPISYTVPIVVSKDLGGLDWVTDWDSTKVSIKDTEVLTPKLFAGEYNPNSDTINGVAIGTDVLNDGQVQGITGYQNNKVSFLLATDGSLLIGNPFEDNGTGLSYNRGRFVLNVDEMAIAGGAVPTWDDMETQLEHHSKDIINAIQDNIDSMNETLNNMTTFVDTILQDELITTLEKVQLDALFQTVTQEVNNIQAQYDSVINNPYLEDEDVRNLEKCYVDYMNAYSNIVDVYNDVFGEPVVEEVEYTAPQEEYLMTDDFIIETVDVVDSDEVFENTEEQPVMLADENVDLNPFMLDTLTTQDGYIIVTKNGQPIQMVTENTLIDFSHAVDILREYSSILQQAISEALLSISENRASQMVEEAKKQVRQEIADVDSALNDLETTMNGSFKSGLIGEQSKAILNERLTQLSIEKKDIDGQYEVLSQNTVLSSSNKETLGIAKDELDAAHDLLVSKINQVIIDNLLTNAELQAVNNLISEYANKLQAYSKVAQECNALIAQTYANAAVAAITDEDVFNKVTNYGALQGLFLKDEKVYINSEYINTRNFKAVTDDGKETFKIDENGEVSITAKSLAITGSSNLATQDYVNTQIENLTNTNITFTLSNEFQIIPTDESYYPLSEGTYAIKVTGYKGSSEEITDFTIGTVTSNDSGIIPVVSNINKTIVLSVSPDAPLSDSNGYVDIPISYDGRDFNKRWSWAVSKQGNQATTVTITGEQFFKYTNNYTGTPTPNKITLTANIFNSVEEGKWQYNDNGVWVDWKQNGSVVTSKQITFTPTEATLPSLLRVFVRYYVDNVFDTYTVTCISDGGNGKDGIDGSNGKDGTSYYFYVRYSANANGYPMTIKPESDTLYIGTYSGTQSVAPSTYSSYTWTLIKGADGENGQDGVAGKDGEDGQTSYLHIKYSDDGETFTANNGEDLGKWIGTKVDFTEKDSITFSDYKWKRFVGEDGSDGSNGLNAQYIMVTGGQTFKYTDNFKGNPTPTSITLSATTYNVDKATYQWYYKQDNSSTWNSIQGATSSKYILDHNNTTIFANNIKVVGLKCIVNSQLEDEITIVKITDGSNGQNGEDGKDGKSVIAITEKYYLSTSQQTLIGGSWQDTAPTWTQGYYIWTKTIFTYSDNTTLETTPICVTGKDGADGLNGGVSVSNVDIFYYQSTSSTELTGGTWLTDAPTWVSGKYVWSKTVTYLDNNTSYESDAVCITGEKGADGKDGIDGAKGEDGTSYYFYIRYSANADGSNMTNIPQSDTEYMGVCSTTLTEAPTSSSAYDWTLIKGADGQDGQDGISGEDGKDGTSSFLHVKYSNDNGQTFTDNNGEDIGTYIGTYVDNTKEDSTVLSDYKWTKFVGDNGEDAYTVLLTNESHSFMANSSGNITESSSTTTKIMAFKGATPITPTIGTLPSVSGLTLSKSGDTVTIKANTGTSLAMSGSFNIPITVDGKSFTKSFSWSKSLAGKDGETGEDAYTVLLTNENHTFVANHLGVTAEQIVTTDVIAYKGATPITPTIGTLPSVTGLTLGKSGVRITIKANANVSTLADSGSFDIPITVDGKSFTKSFSWTKVKDGQNGEDGQPGTNGTNAKSVDLLASNMVFKSTDGGTVFSPDNITLTAQYQNLTHSKWQYSIDGGTTWSNLSNNGGGITGATTTTINIPKTCTFFTDTTTSVVFKAISTDESFYDVVTITKLYDVADVDFEGIAEDIAQDKVDELDEQLNQQNIFNRLTNNGETQGIYLEDEKLYINGEYIKSNSISADSIQTNTLIAPITEELNKENIFVIGMSHCHENYNYDANVLDEKTVELKVRKYDRFSGKPLPSKRVSLGMGGFCPEKGVTYTMSGYIKINGQIPTSWIMSTNVVNAFNSTLSFVYDNTTGYFECTETRRILNGWMIYHSLKSEYNNTVIDDVITIEKLTYVEGTEALEWKPSDFETTFNKLTKDGYLKGLFFDNGKLYMNADYIETGTLKADLIQVRVDGTTNLLPFNYITMDNAINTTAFGVMSTDEVPYLNCQLPIFQGGTSSDVMCTAIGYSDVEIEADKEYYFMCEYYAVWGNDTKPDDGKGTSTATSGSKNGGLQNGQNMTLFLYNGDNVSQAKNNGYYQLATVYDFNSSVKIEERESYPGVYQRTWTTLTARFTATESYKGKLCINLDCSGFFYAKEGGSFYIRRFQLTDATQSNPVFIDYTKQVKEKHMELTDGSYYKNIVGVDGMQIENGFITGDYPLEKRKFEINSDGFKCRSTTGSENAFVGVSQSYYSYDGGSSGQITGYDDIYGFGCREIVGGTGEGVFIGVHHGFQKPNSTSYGRADIYTLYKDGYASDTHDWTLLGQKIEPQGLVRRDDYSNITTQSCLCIVQANGVGGATYNGSTIFNEALYNAVGNGQLINVNAGDNRIYVGNPNSILLLESAYGLTVIEAGEQKQVLTNGTQYGNVQTNIYTGSNIEIWADSDKSSNEEYVWVGAGANAITIKSDCGALSPSSFKYNGNIVYHEGNVYQTLDNAYSGRDVGDLRKIHSYNLYNKSLRNGDGTSSAYGGYWSVLHWGCGGAGSAELAIDWTSQGKGCYMRSLRDTQDNWWRWKRIGNSDWILDSTSDERYKRAVSDVSTEDCYNMVKNIELHTYLLLTEEERYRVEKGELDADELFLRTVTSEGIHHSLQMGVLAQDMLKYSCGTYVVNQDILRDENGELISDRYGIDAYNYASAILGGLQEEIKVRDEQYEELKKENEDLKARLNRLEQLILKGE